MLKWKSFVFLLSTSMLCQGALNIDSLKKVWYNQTLHDTIRLEAMQQISWEGYVFNLPDSAYYFAQLQYDFAADKGYKRYLANAVNTQAVSLWVKGSYEDAIFFHKKSLEIRTEINDSTGMATSLGNIGLVYADMGDYAEAMTYYKNSLLLSNKIGFKKGIANALENIGIVYSEHGNFVDAIENYTRSLRLKEEIDDKNGMANSYNNIGVLYLKQKDYIKAIEYYEKSLEVRKNTGNRRGEALCYNNLGLVYSEKKEYQKAMEFYEKSMVINERLGDKKGIAQASNNIGIIHQKIGAPQKALEFYNKSLTISQDISDNRSTAIALINIGKLLFENGDYKAAIIYNLDALDITNQIGAIKESESAYTILYESYKALDEVEKALQMHEYLSVVQDSLRSKENERAVIRQEYKYKYEKAALADSLKAAEELKLRGERLKRQEAELKQQEIQKYYLSGGILLLVLFGGITLRRYRKSQKQNKIIEEQKRLVEETHKEITDSITYAKRIQNAILPQKDRIHVQFKDSFIMYRPKDVVAGDFYWLERKNDTTLLAVADCTGHGVPGALVSVVCHNGLNRAVNEFGITKPGEILDKTREIVLSEFEKSDEVVSDGMDIALIAIKGNELLYAGANNPVWVVRDGAIIELKPDKQPIGKYTTSKNYNTQTFNLQSSDSLYLFTDGYADQFGGPKGKKFMYKAFKKLLLDIQYQSMGEQKTTIENAYDKWKGSENQVDDLCVIGLRL